MPMRWRKAPVPVVIDHYGLYGDQRPDSADGRRLLDLVASAARLDQAVRALSARSRAAQHQARPRMARGADCGRARSLRLGQRLAASAGARAAEGRVARSAVPRAVLRNAGRRISRRAAVRRSCRADHARQRRRGFTVLVLRHSGATRRDPNPAAAQTMIPARCSAGNDARMVSARRYRLADNCRGGNKKCSSLRSSPHAAPCAPLAQTYPEPHHSHRRRLCAGRHRRHRRAPDRGPARAKRSARTS